MVRAILFDFDGTPVDVEHALRSAVEQVFAQLGLSEVFPKEEQLTTSRLVQTLQRLIHRDQLKLSLVEIQAEIAQHCLRQLFYSQQDSSDVQLLFEGAREANIPLVSLGQEGLSDWAELLQWLANNEHLTIETQSWTADVESYRKAVARVGLTAQECLLFSSSQEAVRVASAAGSMVIALSQQPANTFLISIGATATIHNLIEFGPFSSQAEFEDNIKRLQARQAAYESRLNAYTPYSNFKVGSAIVSSTSGKIYSGCNVENSSYGATICAERGAVLKAVAAEGASLRINQVVVVSDDWPPAVPCALCLQVFAEFCHPKTKFSLYDLRGEGRHFYFEQLLPHPFLMGKKREMLLK